MLRLPPRLSLCAAFLVGRAVFVLGSFVFLAGCAGAPKQPPGAPPSPRSVTRDDPGGDAFEPHRAALTRLMETRWGARRDKDNQLIVPLADPRNWKRVRFWAVDHFTGFRYGKDLHSLNVVFVQDTKPGEPNDAKSCMTKVELWAVPQVESFEIQVDPVSTRYVTWRKHEIPVRSADAHVDFGFGRKHFSAAWASYPAYPGACLVFGLVVPWDGHPELARQVRERWIEEGVPRLRPRTEARPYRK